MAAPDYSQNVPAAERTLRVLEVLSANGEGMTSGELLNQVEGSRSGLYALLNTLKARGYIVAEESRYRLGPALWRLIPDRPRSLDALLTAFPEEAAAAPGDESLALVWPGTAGNIVVAESQPDRPVRVVYRTGAVRPAASPDTRVLDAGGPGEADDLRLVRRHGGASHTDHELTEIAVPVCGDGVKPTAALVVGIPASRSERSHLEAIETSVRQLAARLSYQLGAVVYKPYGWAAPESVGPSKELSAQELDEFLEGQWGAQLACVRSDGTPHVVPLWYEWDGAAMWLAASPGSSWRAFIGENPQVSVTLDEPWAPLRRLFLSGRAVVVGDKEVPGGLEGLRSRLATRYLGHGADSQPELMDTDGWAAVRITPERIHGRQGLGPRSMAESR